MTVDLRPSRGGGVLSEREWKIVEALFRLSPDGPKTVTYEDIVVSAWRLYPDDFGLRGYSKEFPDASDVHKPLYNALKSRGWVSTGPRGQKKFSLTGTGWDRARARFESSSRSTGSRGRATRTTEEIMRHLERSSAAELFLSGRENEILDTDFFAFYRTSVRASAQEFEGKLAQVSDAIDEADNTTMSSASSLRGVDAYLRSRFADVIATKSERRKREV
jgi:hypothetical protein